MKPLFTIFLLAAVSWLGWRHYGMRVENQTLKMELEAANARIAELTGVKPQPVLNWIEERNRNWRSPL